MIFTDKKITINNNQCKIDSPVVLYRGDYNVEVRFTIVSSPYKYSKQNESNIIETTDASFGQLVIQTPNKVPIFSEITATKKGAITFTITAEMIDEVTEIGSYSFQIRLLDENRQSRATIPEVVNGIEIREPIATEDVSTTNEVGVATVGYAVTTVGTSEDAFDNEGNYNKTTWAVGDRITDAKLNKIEVAIDGVNKKIANVGNPTDEQVKNVINEAIANGDIVAGGLTSTAQTLLVNILRSAVFTSDQSANITLLQSELAKGNSGGSSETTKYVITNTLNNATTSNNATLVDANSSYTAIIRENDGYTLDTITVTMGGTDITSSAVSGTTITITSVTGNVVITVTTTESGGSGSAGELPSDGLVAFFDLRSATVESPYNLSGWGNVAKATTPSCTDYFLFNNAGTYTVNEYGVANWGIRGIRQTANERTELSITNNNNSIIGLVYGKCVCGLHAMTATTNIGDEISFTPKYVNTSGETKSLPIIKIHATNYKGAPGYSLYTMTQSATELKLYINGVLKATVNSSECTDFDHWYTKPDGPFYCHYDGNENYCTAFAIYNKTLSDVEVVDATDYFTTLEVK